MMAGRPIVVGLRTARCGSVGEECVNHLSQGTRNTFGVLERLNVAEDDVDVTRHIATSIWPYPTRVLDLSATHQHAEEAGATVSGSRLDRPRAAEG